MFPVLGVQPGGDPNLWNDRSDAREDAHMYISLPADGEQRSETLIRFTRCTFFFYLSCFRRPTWLRSAPME